MRKALATVFVLTVVACLGTWMALWMRQPAPPVPEYQTYTVKESDEEIYTVAALWGVTPGELRYLNNLTSANLEPGQVLKIPGNVRMLYFSSDEAFVEPVAGTYQEYTVGAGEDAYVVAIRWGISPSDLRELNNLSSPNLQPGQVLKVPSHAKLLYPRGQKEKSGLSARLQKLFSPEKETNPRRN